MSKLSNKINCLVGTIMVAGSLLALPPPVDAQQAAKVVTSCGTQTYTNGTFNYPTIDLGGGGCLGTTGTASSSNITQFGGTNLSTGAGGTGAGIPRFTISQDVTTIAGAGVGTAGAASANVVTIQGIAAMTKLLVTPDSVALPANQSVNVSQVNGVTTLTGTGAQGTGSQRVTVATDTATVAGSASIPAGTNIMGKVGIDQTTDITTNGVEIAPTNGAAATPSNYSSGAAEGTKVVQASATNLYRIYAFATAAGLLMTFNSTTVPADGAVTPIECIPVSANNYGAHDMSAMPDRYGTGLSIAFSSGTNCFSKTASATAFFKVSYK